MKYNLKEIQQFKDQLLDILYKGELFEGAGICAELYKMNEGTGFKYAHDIMDALLTWNENMNGIGPSGKLNVDRINFILFIISIPDEDLLETIQHHIDKEYPSS